MPGSHAQRRFLIWKPAAVAIDDGDSAFVQVAGAGVVAEAGPFDEYVFQRRRREIGNARPSCQKSAEIRADRDNGGLLQHDLAEPDVVGIGAPARPRAPGQRAPGYGRTNPTDRGAAAPRFLG